MPTTPRLAALVLAAVSLGCSPTTSSTTPPETGGDPSGGGAGGPTIGSPPTDAGAGGTAGDATTDPAGGPSGQTATGTTAGPGPTTVAGGGNDGRFLGPEISHSKGVAGGVVVLFPRIIPGTIAAENQSHATAVQQKVKALVERALPGRPVDVRPSPERVCPKTGCDAMSVGVLFSRNQNSCIAVAIVNAPGVSQTKLVPWGGEVVLKSDTIQFRDPPESFVTIKDYVPCDQLTAEMTKQDSFVEAAVRAAAGGAAATSPAPQTPPGGAAPSNVSAKAAGK